MANPFTAHPASVGETYGQHCRFAIRFGSKMMLGGFATVVHGVFPFLFERTGSGALEALNGELAAAARGPLQPPDPRGGGE